MIDLIAQAKTAWDKNVPRDLIKEYILTVYGPEAKYYAENWYPDDKYLLRFLYNIHLNQENIQNKSVLEVGPGHGLWLLLCYLYGASEVYGIEPRTHTKDGIETFYKQAGFTGKIYTGTDSDIPTICKQMEFDTVMLLNAIDHFQHQQTALRSLMNFCPSTIWLEHYDLRKDDILENFQHPWPELNPAHIVGVTVHRLTSEKTIKTCVNPYQPGNIDDKWVKNLNCMDTIDTMMKCGGYDVSSTISVDFNAVNPNYNNVAYTCYKPLRHSFNHH